MLIVIDATRALNINLAKKSSRLEKRSVVWNIQQWTILVPLARFLFVAFCSFFPCSLTVFIQGRQQNSGGRQQKSSRADKQHCFP